MNLMAKIEDARSKTQQFKFAAMGPNQTLINAFYDKEGNRKQEGGGIIPLRHMKQKDAWEVAIDAVTYHTALVPAEFQIADVFGDWAINPDSGDPIPLGILHEPAIGRSPTGRPKSYYFVVVNPFRDYGRDENDNFVNNYDVIHAVSSDYKMVEMPKVYRAFKRALDKVDAIIEAPHRVESLYVNGNGGQHALTISAPLYETAVGNEITYPKLRLISSLDGTKSQQLTMYTSLAHPDGEVDMVMPRDKESLNSYARVNRHTTAIEESMLDFEDRLFHADVYWKEHGMKYIKRMQEKELSEQAAIKKIREIGSKIVLGVANTDLCAELYVDTTRLRTKVKGHNMWRVLVAVNQVIHDEMESARDLQDRQRLELAKYCAKL